MFKNREIKVSVDKKPKVQLDGTSDIDRFEQKLDIVLDRLEKIGIKIFVGVCIFVALDTARRVATEMSKDESSE